MGQSSNKNLIQCIFVIFLFIISLNSFGQKKLVIDKINKIEVTPGESVLYYNVLFQRYDSLVQVFLDGNRLYSINDTILTEISYDEVNQKYIAEWRFKKDNVLIQKGTFNNKGNADGRFNIYLFYEIAYCNYVDGVKEGLQVFKDDTYTNVNSFSNNKLHGVTYVLEDNFLLESIRTYKNGLLHGNSTGYAAYEDAIILQYDNEYRNGKIADGISINYYPSGKIFMKEEYKDGVIHGFSITYNEDGEIVHKVKYHKGEIVPKEKW